jgi:putative restriction endonuclease
LTGPNGLALSKNAHWLFDQGLWSVTDDYRVVVAHQRFAEAAGPADAFPLLVTYHGRKLHLPEGSDCWPNAVHLAWHRREHGV